MASPGDGFPLQGQALDQEIPSPGLCLCPLNFKADVLHTFLSPCLLHLVARALLPDCNISELLAQQVFRPAHITGLWPELQKLLSQRSCCRHSDSWEC